MRPCDMVKNKKGYNIYKNAIRYFSYPSSIKPLVEMEDKVRFPKGIFCEKLIETIISNISVTLCMNGLHSKKKLRSAYPQFDDRILRHIYSGLPPSGR